MQDKELKSSEIILNIHGEKITEEEFMNNIAFKVCWLNEAFNWLNSNSYEIEIEQAKMKCGSDIFIMPQMNITIKRK